MNSTAKKIARKSNKLFNNALFQNKITKPIYKNIVSGNVSVGQYEMYVPPMRVGLLDKPIDKFIQKRVEDKKFWDIGANIGYYSILASQHAEQIRSFEPEPNNFSILEENIKKNNINNIEALEVAVSNEDGQAKLYRESIQGGAIHSLAEDKRLNKKPCNVEVRSIDSLIKQNNVPDVIKVDVEGAEQKVLEGGIESLKNNNIEWLIEIHSPETIPENENNTNRLEQHGGDFKTIYELLDTNGYNIVGVQGNETIEFDIESNKIPLYWYAKK